MVGPDCFRARASPSHGCLSHSRSLSFVRPLLRIAQDQARAAIQGREAGGATQPAQSTAPAESRSEAAESTKPEEKAFKGMKYRMIGPFRGGRSLTAAGIPGDPTTYYFGATGGGVWKSTDGAMTWSSVFDKEGTSAIGSIAVANSNHNVTLRGDGRGLHSRQHLARRRRVQVAGWRQDLEERGTARLARHRQSHHESHES